MSYSIQVNICQSTPTLALFSAESAKSIRRAASQASATDHWGRFLILGSFVRILRYRIMALA
jgi:hypothetical protein